MTGIVASSTFKKAVQKNPQLAKAIAEVPIKYLETMRLCFHYGKHEISLKELEIKRLESEIETLDGALTAIHKTLQNEVENKNLLKKYVVLS